MVERKESNQTIVVWLTLGRGVGYLYGIYSSIIDAIEC